MSYVKGQRIAIVSVYDKTGLLDLAKGLVQQNVRILASGGTSKMIRESGIPVEYAYPSNPRPLLHPLLAVTLKRAVAHGLFI